MPKRIVYKMKFYKRFETDIWGTYVNDPIKNNKYMNIIMRNFREKKEDLRPKHGKYIYRIDIINPKRIVKRHKKKFLTMYFVKLFYRGLTSKKFYKLFNFSITWGFSWIKNFLLFMEAHIFILSYRLNWVSSILFTKEFLLNGSFLLNHKPIFNLNQIAKVSDIFQISPIHENKVKNEIRYRLETNLIYSNIPRYIHMSFALMYAIIFKAPSESDVSYPILIDAQRIMDLF